MSAIQPTRQMVASVSIFPKMFSVSEATGAVGSAIASADDQQRQPGRIFGGFEDRSQIGPPVAQEAAKHDEDCGMDEPCDANATTRMTNETAQAGAKASVLPISANLD